MKIKLLNLSKAYKNVKAVNDVCLEIQKNKIFALLGINGAGKTTIIKMMSGLIKKDSGKIFYGDLNIDDNINEIKKIINISPQETAIAENLTVFENLLFIAEIYGLKKDIAKQKAEELIVSFDLSSIKNKKAKHLSGGTKRRLSIAMSLVTEPKVLFLDEPTLGLDVISRSNLWKLIENLKSKMTIILTTHYIEEAESLADMVAVINNGKIISQGSPSQLIKQHKSKSLEEAFIKIVQGEKLWEV